MAKFRKKPVVIDAIQLTKDTFPDVLAFIGFTPAVWNGESPVIYIKTLEGTMEAREGDWIIKGVKGEFYPCKNDIFEATYEAV